MQPRRGTLRPGGGRVARERLDQPVAAAPVDRSRAAQVAIQLAALDQDREPELLQQRGRPVVVGLLVEHRRAELVRYHQPAEAERRRHRLAHRPRVDDACGIEPLERPDRRAVVAVLGVVVVLEDERAAPGGPGQHACAALRESATPVGN